MDTRTTPAPPHAEYFPPERPASLPGRWIDSVIEDLAQLRAFWPVVQNMVVQDLRVRYQRSVLGFLWTLLNPILMMATLTVVFANLLGLGGDWRKHAIYIFAGQVPWLFLAGSLNDCALCIILNEGLIRKIYLPKLIFPLNRVLFHLVNFVLSLGALFLLLIPIGAQFYWPMLMLPVSILLFACFMLGLGILIAVLNTFYRDCSHLVGVVLQAWYFMTPIIYEAKLYQTNPWFLSLNPAYAFIRQFHMIIRDGVWPDPTTILISLGLALASLGAGYAAYKVQEKKLVFRL
jgi:ABC-2 type transport system permease protein/lipopolysaccharide transport system permease protein